MSSRRCSRGSGAALVTRSPRVGIFRCRTSFDAVLFAVLQAVPLVVLCALSLVACGATHKKLDLPRDQVAEVHGLDEHPTFGMGRGIAFEAVDGKRFPSGTFASLPMVVDVLPGKHVIRCLCTSSFDGIQGPTGSVDFEFEAKAGAIYQSRFDFGARGEMRLRFIELTREQAEAIRAKEEQAAKDLAGPD